MDVSNPVSKSAVVSDFIARVKNPVWTSVTAVLNRWGTENTPWAPYMGYAGNNRSTNQPHRMLGSRNSEPNPTWPAYENSGAGINATTNVFFVLHSFALRLTRHRLARGMLRYGTSDRHLNLGYRLTSYASNNTIWFNPPAMPAPGTTVTAAQIDAFMTSLKNSVDAIRGDANLASDIVGCHASCHSSCHGSRGRR